MKISKSKKELARIISENGGWREGAEFAWFQGKLKGRPCREVWFGEEGSEPEYVPASGSFHSYWSMVVDKFPAAKFDNWHQTILSREEYFHLYPAPDADGWIEYNGEGSPYSDEVVVEAKWSDGDFTCSDNFGPGCAWIVNDGEPNITHHRLHKPEQAGATDKLSSEAVSAAKIALMSDSIEELVRKPTIEQLAADYRKAKDYAERKQQEADAARVDADGKLKSLELAGEAIGLPVSPITTKKDPELVITDWRYLMVGDVIEYVDGDIKDKIGMSGPVVGFAHNADDGMHVQLECDGTGGRRGRRGWPRAWRFIRRP